MLYEITARSTAKLLLLRYNPCYYNFCLPYDFEDSGILSPLIYIIPGSKSLPINPIIGLSTHGLAFQLGFDDILVCQIFVQAYETTIVPLLGGWAPTE